MDINNFLKKDFMIVLFTCSICRKDLKGHLEPYLLPCLHSLCQECLSASVEHCGYCSQKFDVNSVIKNYLVHQINLDRTKPQCTSCEDGAQAICFCTNCKEVLCELCLKAHKRVRATRAHFIKQPLVKEDIMGLLNQDYCSKHSQELLKYFCSQCATAACAQCLYIDHMGHHFKTLKEERDNTVVELREFLLEYDSYEKSSTDLYEDFFQFNHKISHEEMNIFQAIISFSRGLITSLKSCVKENERKVLEIIREEFNKNKDLLEHLNNIWLQYDHYAAFIRKAIVIKNDLIILIHMKHINKQIEKILNTQVLTPPSSVDIPEVVFRLKLDSLNDIFSLKIGARSEA